MSPSFREFGLPCAPALGAVLLTWRIGRRLYGAPPGPHGRDRHETLVGNALYVRRASTDQLFVFCLAVAMYGFSATPSGRIAAEPRFLLFTWARLAVLAKPRLRLDTISGAGS